MAESNASVQHLGVMLKSLRIDSGFTGHQLATKVPLSQSAISKLETGKSGLPEWSRIEMILDVLSATDVQRDAIRRQYELAQLDPASYLFMVANGADVQQRRFSTLEAEALLIRDFQNSVIPGLLQTPAYAAHVFHQLGHSKEAAKAAARERLIRQVIVNDPTKRFVFIVMDCAIYSPHAGLGNHVQQLDQLLSRTTATNVTIRILDSRAGVPISLSNPFMIIDRRFVSAETAVRELTSTVPAEIQEYESLFRQLLECSLAESDSRDFIEVALAVFSSRLESGISTSPRAEHAEG